MRERFCIAFHNMTPPFGAHELARDNAIALERLSGHAVPCKVTIEKTHRRGSRGNLFQIAIELMVLEQRIVVYRDPPEGGTHEGLHTAIADAFATARRQLEARGPGRVRDAPVRPAVGHRGHPPAASMEHGGSRPNAAAAI
jgi:hypothetical protein